MAQRWEQFERSFETQSVSKTVLEGSSPSTPANKKRSNVFTLLRFFTLEGSNPERAKSVKHAYWRMKDGFSFSKVND